MHYIKKSIENIHTYAKFLTFELKYDVCVLSVDQFSCNTFYHYKSNDPR